MNSSFFCSSSFQNKILIVSCVFGDITWPNFSDRICARLVFCLTRAALSVNSTQQSVCVAAGLITHHVDDSRAPGGFLHSLTSICLNLSVFSVHIWNCTVLHKNCNMRPDQLFTGSRHTKDILTKLSFQYGRRGCCCWADCCHVPAVPVVVLWWVCLGPNKNPRQPTYCLYSLWIVYFYIHRYFQEKSNSMKTIPNNLSGRSMRK